MTPFKTSYIHILFLLSLPIILLNCRQKSLCTQKLALLEVSEEHPMYEPVWGIPDSLQKELMGDAYGFNLQDTCGVIVFNKILEYGIQDLQIEYKVDFGFFDYWNRGCGRSNNVFRILINRDGDLFVENNYCDFPEIDSLLYSYYQELLKNEYVHQNTLKKSIISFQCHNHTPIEYIDNALVEIHNSYLRLMEDLQNSKGKDLCSFSNSEIDSIKSIYPQNIYYSVIDLSPKAPPVPKSFIIDIY